MINRLTRHISPFFYCFSLVRSIEKDRCSFTRRGARERTREKKREAERERNMEQLSVDYKNICRNEASRFLDERRVGGARLVSHLLPAGRDWPTTCYLQATIGRRRQHLNAKNECVDHAGPRMDKRCFSRDMSRKGSRRVLSRRSSRPKCFMLVVKLDLEIRFGNHRVWNRQSSRFKQLREELRQSFRRKSEVRKLINNSFDLRMNTAREFFWLNYSGSTSGSVRTTSQYL